ncbi:hypothetical protein SUDANB70_05423 [Streptomyces sp. enrichment culture]
MAPVADTGPARSVAVVDHAGAGRHLIRHGPQSATRVGRRTATGVGREATVVVRPGHRDRSGSDTPGDDGSVPQGLARRSAAVPAAASRPEAGRPPRPATAHCCAGLSRGRP